MKLSIFVGAVALMLLAETAYADCTPPGRLNQTQIGNVLRDNTVCAQRGDESWQEEHHADGKLWDFKLGDDDPIDPRKQVGTWSITGTGSNTTVTYDYGSGGSYTYSVWNNGGGSYSFCSGGTLEMDFTVTSGTNVGCP